MARSREQFRLPASRARLAGGVAIAAKLASDFGSWRTTAAEVEQVAVVLADRSPDWLADFIDRHLKHQFGIAAWPLARALVRLGAIPRPDVPEYATLMPNGVTWHAHEGNAQVQTPLQALLADAGLLEDEIWRLFAVPEAGKVLADIDGRHEWLEECRGRAVEAIEVHIAGLLADGEPIPEEIGAPRLLAVTVAA